MSPNFVAEFPYDIKLRLVEHTAFGWVPTRPVKASKITFSDPYSATPTLIADISPVIEPDFGDFDVVDVEISDGEEWFAPLNCRFVLSRDTGDSTDPADMTNYRGIGYAEFQLQRGRVMPTTGPNDINGERIWRNQTPGYILKAMIDEGQARDWGSWFQYTFTNTLDSGSTNWETTDLERAYRHGTPYSQVLEGFVNEGLVEYAMNYREYLNNSQMEMWNPGQGDDHTVNGADPKIDLSAANLQQAPIRRSIEEVATRVTAAGDGVLRVTEEDFTGTDFEKFGQLEGWIAAGGVDKQTEAQKIALAELQSSTKAKGEYTFKYDVNGAPRHLWPYVSYKPGDWVLAPSRTGLARFRVAKITLEKSDNSVVATVVVGDPFGAGLPELARRQRAGSGWSKPGGSQTPPTGLDLRVPNAPTGLSMSTEGYWDEDGAARSKITLEWSPVTHATQGDPITIALYEIWYRLSPTANWKQLTISADTDIDWLPFEPGTTVYTRVRARSTAGQWSAFSSSANVTVVNPTGNLQAPDDPTVTSDNAGIVYAEWNGLLATTAPPPQFSYVLTQVSDDESGPFAIAGQQLLAAGTSTIGGLAPGEHWVRLVPYDRLGQAGTPSNAIPVTVVDVMSRKPAAPENVAAVSEGYWEGVTPQSRITVSWDEVTEGEDAEPITIRLYEVWGERDGVPAHPLITTAPDVLEVVIEALAPLAEWTITVRAQSEFLALSDFSDEVVVETEAPPMTLDAPTTPTVTSELGLIHVYWDGNVGDPPVEAPAFLRAVVVEISDDWDGSDGTWIPVGSLLSAGQRGTVTGIAPGLQRWVRLSALDMFGRFSDPSEVVAVTVQGTGETIIADAVQVGVLAAAVITAGTDDILQLIAGQVEIITSQLDPLQAQVDAQGETVAAVEQRFTFDATGLTIASPDSQFKLRLDNDSLDFIVGDTVRAYLTAEAWNAQRVVTSSLRVGLWEFVQENPPSDPDAPGTGSLLMKYTG